MGTKLIAPKVCIDDILVASEKDFEEHLGYLDEIMKRLKCCSLQVNVSKLAICQKGV